MPIKLSPMENPPVSNPVFAPAKRQRKAKSTNQLDLINQIDTDRAKSIEANVELLQTARQDSNWLPNPELQDGTLGRVVNS